MQEIQSQEDFFDEHRYKFLSAVGCVVFIYLWLGEGVVAILSIMGISATVLVVYEYKSVQREDQAYQERITEALIYRADLLKSGEGWTKQDVLNKFRTTLYYSRHGSLTTTTGWRCAACSKNLYQVKDAELDHILPRSKYPHLEMSEKNLQILCRSCNAHKHAYDGDDWRKTIHKRRRAKNRKSK